MLQPKKGIVLQPAREGFRLESAVLDCVGAAIYLVQAGHPLIVYTNPKLDALFGYGPGELLGQHVEIINAPAGAESREYHEVIIASLRQKKEWRGEVLSRRKDGSLFWCQMTASVLEHPDHGTLCLGARQDIHERKLAEAALYASEARFRGVFSQAAVGIAWTALDGRWLEVNDRLCAIVGYRREELLALSFQDITYGPDLESDLARLRRFLAGELASSSMEKRYVRKDGSLVWVNVTVSLVRTPAGEPDYFIAVIEDIHGRKDAEAALEAARRSHLQHLEQQVAERTAALQEAHDHLEERVAERADQVRRLAAELTFAEERERQALARDLHDDLGQLLHVVRVKLNLLAREGLAPGGVSLVHEASGLISDASRLVRSLTSQLSPPVLSTLGLPAALQWLCGEMQETYGLSVSCRTDMAPGNLSPSQGAILFRAARELLINAARHSGSDRASLELVREAGFLTLIVGDPGNGTRVLEKALLESKGFGLASARERISFLGGTTTLRTPAEGGVEIILQLPGAAGK